MRWCLIHLIYFLSPSYSVYTATGLNIQFLHSTFNLINLPHLTPILSINQIQARTSPPGQTSGEFFEVVKSPAPGQNFPAKARPPGQKTPTPGEYFRRSSQPFLLTGIEILGFFRNQRLKRIERLSYYSLVIPSSFRLSTILKVLKFSPSFGTDFVTRE